jgi:hypothetical protein
MGISMMLSAVTASGMAQMPQTVKRYPVTSEMVVAAMHMRQLPVEGVQVRIAAPITATVANPMLEIETLTRTDERSAQMRVACRVRSECLTFYVSATWSGAVAKVVPASLELTPQHEPGEEIEREVGFSVRTGAPMTLLIEDDKVHVRMRVVCLQSGGPGDTVRVATPDHRLYRAEVVSPTLLKGSFPE